MTDSTLDTTATTQKATQDRRVLFCGTPEFAALQLKALLGIKGLSVVGVLTQPDRPAGRGQKVLSSPVKACALLHQIPVFQPTSLRKESEQTKQFLASIGPLDIAIVAAYGLIVPAWFLMFPKQGCVNVHASMLPRWRGAAPIQRALLAGDTETGVCLMQMEEGLDTGPVFASASLPIKSGDTSREVHDRLAELGANLLREHLLAFLDGKRPPVAQPTGGVTYAHKIEKEEAQLDWNLSASEIDRRVRAFNPTPGAFTLLAGERLKIWRGHVFAGSRPSSRAFLQTGSIEIVTDTNATPRLLVSCGTDQGGTPTYYEITELQIAGGKRCSVADYLRGAKLASGARLGA